MKIITIALLCCPLSGCLVGEGFPFTVERGVIIDHDRICISIDKKDIVDFYSLSSSKDNYKKEIINTGNAVLNYTYPQSCFLAPLQFGYEYTLLYTMNGQTYRYEFFIDLNGQIFHKK
jgi:hypothetical protein